MKVPIELQAAFWRLSNKAPYISDVLWNLKLIESTEVPTMATDANWRTYYNPDFVKGLKVEETEAVLYHECWHVLQDYFSRAKYFDDPQEFNAAADREINGPIRQAGFHLPDGALFASDLNMPDGKLAEEYYQKDSKKKTGKEGWQCGSAAGNPGAWELSAPGGNERMSEGEKELIRQSVARAIDGYPGNVPGRLRRWAEERVHPTVPWQTELRAVLRRNYNEIAGQSDYTYRRPSRKQWGQKVILPAIRAYVPHVGVLGDTSGSMDQQDLAVIMAETEGIIRAISGPIIFISCDTEAQAQKILSGKAAALHGGGGTDLRVGFEEAARQKPKLDLLVVVTDGETPWPEDAPNFRTIVVQTRRSRWAEKVPEWAKVIHVNTDKENH